MLGLPVSRRLGRLRQATVWRTRTRPALFGSLHAPRSHFQPPHSRSQPIPGDLPMERLCTPQQATHHASDLRGISASLLAARLAEGFSTHSILGWLANRRRNKLLPLCRDLLPPLAQQPSAQPAAALWLCPRCHGPMAVLERLTAVQLLDTEGTYECILDSS